MVELAIADGRYEDAARLVDQAIDWMGEAEETGTRNRVECLALGLRAAALAIDAARSRRDAVEETALRARAAGHIGAVRRFADGPLGPLSGAGGETRGYVAMAEAEYRAIAGEPDPDAWAAAVAIWRELGRPWPLATALSREAEAILAARRSRVDAAAPLAESLAIAGELGAAPLAAWCLSLARMGRVELPDQPTSGDGAGAAEAPIAASSDGSVSTPSAAAFGLTPRELDVLRLLAEGYSNREIGGTLYISESTAGVHVSNILGKLGVSGRVEAAAVAVRSGLVD
jgi:DNA-binding CsgD family transcriptional regulator